MPHALLDGVAHGVDVGVAHAVWDAVAHCDGGAVVNGEALGEDDAAPISVRDTEEEVLADTCGDADGPRERD